MTLKDSLEALASAFSGDVGIAVEPLSGGERVSIRGDEIFPTASAIKVFVLFSLLLEADRKTLDLRERVRISTDDRTLGSGVLLHLDDGLEPTLRDLAVLMMMVSDNLATNHLIARLGVATINADIRAAGLERTELRSRIDFSALSGDKSALGVATPDELARFFARLGRGELLSEPRTRELIDVLRIQKYIEPLRRELPADPYAREFGDAEPVWVASKTGSLSGVRCEAGLVHTPHAEWAIAVMTKNGTDPRVTSDNEGVVLIAKASRAAFDAFAAQ